ncbi:cytochrome c [Paenibacillus oenotherae]|uniref:Cytochrome c n=1 Tax=Paenibacillus oenotherae TaxID=1435645 RepID=A0ABS7DCE3_9BACL|nr:cytochrome c [Paenibacillus oenotherae]MBW7476828.1 cytochrome c [Paenibacillus oenotherae]
MNQGLSATLRRKLRQPLLYAVAALGTVLLLAGCGESPTAVSSPELDGPAAVMEVYKSNCLSCHGTDLQGKMGPSTDLTKVGARMTADQIAEQINDGGGGMPKFDTRLSEDEVKQLASWLSEKK